MNAPVFASVGARRALTLVVLLALTAVLIRDAVFPLTALPTLSADQGQMAWNLWHVSESVLSGRNPYLTRMIFFPSGANLATHTLAGGFFPVTLVVKALVHATGAPDAFYPVIAYKAIVFLCFFLLQTLTYRFLRHLGCTRVESLVPAVAYAFCAFYRLHSAHLNHLAGFFIPWSAWRLVAAARYPTWRNTLIAALVTGASVYFTEFSLFIWMGTGFVLLGLALSAEGRVQLRNLIGLLGPARIGTAMVLFGVVVAVFAAHFIGSRAVSPPAEASAHYSSNLAGFVIPTPHTSRVWASTVARWDPRITTGMGGYEIFVGYTFLLLGCLGLRRQPLAVRVTFCVAIVFFLLSMGPRLKVLGWDTSFPMPYAVLRSLPGFEQNRTPVRFVAVAMFLWTVPAAIGLRAAQAWISGLLPGMPRDLVALTALAGVTAENYGAQGLHMKEAAFPLAALAGIKPGPVLNIPLDDVGVHSGLQILHGQPIATGYLARLSKRQTEQLDFLSRSTDAENGELLVWLARRRFQTILTDRPMPWVVLKPLVDWKLDVVNLNGPNPTAVVAKIGSTDGVGRMPHQWTAEDRIDAMGRTSVLTGTAGIRQIDLLADCDETYLVTLFGAGQTLAELSTPPARCPGLRWRSVWTPQAVRDGVVDQVRVRPSGGDGIAAARGLLLLK